MFLKDILTDLDPLDILGGLNIEITNIVYDSRKVIAGSVFICIDGFKVDGHQFIEKAIQNGAVAIIIERDLDNYLEGVTYVRVADSREAMSYLAAAFYDYPLEKLKLIGVTGTNGKTTTTFLIKNILGNAGYITGLIGTIKVIVGDHTLPATRTTPESLDLYEIFAMMVREGITHIVMEVSSHALDLKRVAGMEFSVTVFTNISQDHLDYHKTIDEYTRAKSMLFAQISPDGYAVVNVDDIHSKEIIKSVAGKLIRYAVERESDLKASQVKLSPRGVSFDITGLLDFNLNMNLTGLFNVYNSLAAIGSAYALGLKEGAIKKGLESIIGVPGRFEVVDEGQDFSVVVDYAHTPDGMENVLKTALEFVKGDIIVVFGCGGDRDRGKRPLMGQMANRYGNFSVLTSDNPRSEEPLNIIKDIEQGIKEMEDPTPYIIIPDRKKAIFQAIKKAKKGDMVVVFGKGHETYQIFKDRTISFDDREVARQAIRERLS